MPDNQRKQVLTSRQEEVLNLVRKGLTNAEICRTLNISENTVKVHLANIYKILEVTNRTEAVSANQSKEGKFFPHEQSVNVVFEPEPNLKDCPLAYSLYLSVVEGLVHYQLFSISIQEHNDSAAEATYKAKVFATQNKFETVFFSISYRDSREIIWSTQQKVRPDDDISTLTSTLISALFRNISISASKKFEENKDVAPIWWLASCYTITKMINRNKEAFSKCEAALTPLTECKSHPYVIYSLVTAYYVGIIENWISAENYLEKIKHFACTAMRSTPHSIYSQFMMALYNILIGNKADAIVYFKQIIEENPYDTLARRLLVQICLLVEPPKKALEQQDSFESFLSQTNDSPYTFIVKAFIYFMQGNYNDCEKLSKQGLLIYPEAPFARLLLIACYNKKGLLKDSSEHIRKFFEFHPNFTKNDLDKLMNGIEPSRKKIFIDSLNNLFV